MKTRKEAAALINKELSGDRHAPADKHGKHHYGKVELRHLTDFIYGGEPNNKDEEVE